MAWLRLTHRDGIKCLVNIDQVSEIYVCSGAYRPTSAIRMDDGLIAIEETFDEIAAMIADAEWRERVLKCACAIMSSTTLSSGLTSEQVWARAARFAMMEPERPGASIDR